MKTLSVKVSDDLNLKFADVAAKRKENKSN
jgi:hypothetical protein